MSVECAPCPSAETIYISRNEHGREVESSLETSAAEARGGDRSTIVGLGDSYTRNKLHVLLVYVPLDLTLLLHNSHKHTV